MNKLSYKDGQKQDILGCHQDPLGNYCLQSTFFNKHVDNKLALRHYTVFLFLSLLLYFRLFPTHFWATSPHLCPFQLTYQPP